MRIDDRSILIGLGCASAASAEEIIALVEACLIEAGFAIDQITAFASHSRKLGSIALREAAAHFGSPLYFLDDEDLAPGIPGTCEAVAASAGPLVLSKRKSRYATCAIAYCAVGSIAQPARTAARAASTLPTSAAAA